MSASRLSFTMLAAGLGLLAFACGGSRHATQPPQVAPTPSSVTKDKPGGNAHDPHFAALHRQIDSSFGWRTDKDNQARFPLPDQKNWTRVRFMLIDHFVGFKYGKDEHAVTAGFVVKMPPDAPKTSAACVQQFERDSLPKVSEMGGEVTNFKTKVKRWNKEILVVRKGTGKVRFLGKKYNAALAWAGYPAYKDACMVYAVAIPWDGHPELARQVRNRWTHQFRQFRPLTEETPYRHK